MTPTAAASTTDASLTAGPNAWRVEVFRRPEIDDPEGTHALASIRELGITSVTGVRLGRGYLLPIELGRDGVEAIVADLLADPVLDEARVYEPGQPPERAAAAHVLVARRPGVMDPVATTLVRALRRGKHVALDAPLHVQTFSAWELEGTVTEAEALTLARRALANEVIEEIHVADEGLLWGVPSAAQQRGVVQVPLLEADDAELQRISTDGVLSLNLVEMKAVQAHYAKEGREPTACELETVAQTWSEHCQHKTFRGLIEMDGEVIDNLLKTTIAATHELDKDWCISVFHDNAGIIEFEPDVDGGWDLAFKVETHNHPSAIDPYGGAGTGIGGVIRDILGVGMGAKPIANTNAFFVGPPDMKAEDVPKGSLHPARVLRGVVSGVRDYGNRMGIPTVAGGVWFDQGYTGNPLVYAGTVGLIPREMATKSVEPGDVIVVAGGRTGRDGIHGATFSSVELHEDSETVSASAVQIGDPITEKKVLDGLLRARDARLYRGITDCGAGGLSSAVGEMGEHCGAEVHLETVPLKYPGLTPEEIWISEAQERMVFAVQPENLDALIQVFREEDVEATAIGHFTDTKRLVLKYDGDVHGDIAMAFLHDGTPRPTRQASWTAPNHPDPGAPALDDPGATLLALLKRPNIASKQWIVRQYDHEVQGMSVTKAHSGVTMDAPSDGVVLKPLVESMKGVALGQGANPNYGQLDPKAMAEAVIDEALRNVVAAGGDPERTAILDNFSWGNCDKPDRLGQLVLASKGCYDAAMAYGTPFISGKDSLNNEYRVGDTTLAIPPTLYLSAMSIVPDVREVCTMDAKRAGNHLVLLGDTHVELGGSEWFTSMNLRGGRVPRPDLSKAPAALKAVHTAQRQGLIASCHDLSEGGLAVAVAETCMAGQLGAAIELEGLGTWDGCDATSTALFSESCTRFLVEVAPEDLDTLREHMAANAGPTVHDIGVLNDRGRLTANQGGSAVFDLAISDIHAAFHGSFQG